MKPQIPQVEIDHDDWMTLKICSEKNISSPKFCSPPKCFASSFGYLIFSHPGFGHLGFSHPGFSHLGLFPTKMLSGGQTINFNLCLIDILVYVKYVNMFCISSQFVGMKVWTLIYSHAAVDLLTVYWIFSYWLLHGEVADWGNVYNLLLNVQRWLNITKRA